MELYTWELDPSSDEPRAFSSTVSARVIRRGVAVQAELQGSGYSGFTLSQENEAALQPQSVYLLETDMGAVYWAANFQCPKAFVEIPPHLHSVIVHRGIATGECDKRMELLRSLLHSPGPRPGRYAGPDVDPGSVHFVEGRVFVGELPLVAEERRGLFGCCRSPQQPLAPPVHARNGPRTVLEMSAHRPWKADAVKLAGPVWKEEEAAVRRRHLFG